jgi:hypothetical protein
MLTSIKTPNISSFFIKKKKKKKKIKIFKGSGALGYFCKDKNFLQPTYKKDKCPLNM